MDCPEREQPAPAPELRRLSKRRCRREVAVDPRSEAQWPVRTDRPGLLGLPYEIHLEILTHLGIRDLLALRKVSPEFEALLRAPTVWKLYEIWDNEMPTSEVISDLKAMPHLRKISISNRVDCDELLRQISLSNKRLEELYIVNCTGSTFDLKLRAANLTHILERCRRLRCFTIHGSRFSSVKFYRLLGQAFPRLRAFAADSSFAQVSAFVENMARLSEKDRCELVQMTSNVVEAHNRTGCMEINLAEGPEHLPAAMHVSYCVDGAAAASLQVQLMPLPA